MIKEEGIPMTYFTDLQIKRRSIYALGKDLELSNQELIETIQGAVLNTPTAFNSQTSRVVILLDEESDAFWNEIAYSELEKLLRQQKNVWQVLLKLREQSSSMKIKM